MKIYLNFLFLLIYYFCLKEISLFSLFTLNNINIDKLVVKLVKDKYCNWINKQRRRERESVMGQVVDDYWSKCKFNAIKLLTFYLID